MTSLNGRIFTAEVEECEKKETATGRAFVEHVRGAGDRCGTTVVCFFFIGWKSTTFLV